MSLYVYQDSSHVTIGEYIDGTFGADRAKLELLARLTDDIVRQLGAEETQLKVPRERLSDSMLVWKIDDENFIDLLAALDATLKSPRLSPARNAVLTEVQKLATIVHHLIRTEERAAPPSLTVTASSPSQSFVAPKTLVTDIFKVTYGATGATSEEPGSFDITKVVISQPNDANGTAGTILPAGFTVNGQPVEGKTVEALRSHVKRLPLAGPGALSEIGVQYYVPAELPYGAAIVDELSLTLTGSDAIAEYTAPAIRYSFASPPIAVAASGPVPVAAPGSTVTCSFALTNLSGVEGHFDVVADATIVGPAGSLQGIQYVLATPGGGSSTVDLSGLRTWLKNQSVAPGASLTLGLQFTGPDGDAGQPVFCALTASFSALEQSSAETALVSLTIQPKPQLGLVSNQLQPPKTVTPGTVATDSFVLTNESGQPATIALASADLSVSIWSGTEELKASRFTNFTLAAPGGTTLTAATLADLNKKLAGLVVAAGAQATLSVSYKVPDGEAGRQLSDTLTAYAIAGKVNQPAHSSASVTSTLGSLGDVLANLVGPLDTEHRLPAGKLVAAQTSALLRHADQQVELFVSDARRVSVTSHDLAHALAIHDLVDDLYSRLIDLDRPAALLDVVP